MSAYRIIREALTNVIKHAASSRAGVTICYSADSVTVEITNEGPAKPGTAVARDQVETGHGIIGMRERVAVFGGEFAAGPQPGGGFRVRARLPIAEVTS
jgi:signal transduction histidine kinase